MYIEPNQAAESQYQNGPAEALWNVAERSALAILEDSGLDSKFWPFAYSQAVYTRNLTYIKKYDAAPISSLYQTEGYPTKQLQALRKFGSIAYVYVPREHRKIFNSRAKAGIYVGNCPITGAWLIYFREDNAVIRTISAKFDEDSPPAAHTPQTRQLVQEQPSLPDRISQPPDHTPRAKPPAQAGTSHRETSPSGAAAPTSNDLDGALIHMEEAMEEEPPIAPPREIRDHNAPGVRELVPLAPARPRVPNKLIYNNEHQAHRANHYSPLINTFHSAIFSDVHSVGITSYLSTESIPYDHYTYLLKADSSIDSHYEQGIRVPSSIREARATPEWPHWEAAIHKELGNHSLFETGVLVKLEPGMRVLPTGWVFKLVFGPNNEVVKYKARWILKGHKMIQGIDYHETYAGVAHMPGVRVFCSLIFQHGLTPAQLDFKAAYLHAPMEETLYAQQPEGYEESYYDKRTKTHTRYALELRKSLYGAPQSGRNLWKKVKALLLDLGLVESFHSPNVYTLCDGDLVVMIVLVYVDDLPIAASDKKYIEWFKEKLTDAGFLYEFQYGIDQILGINFSYEASKRLELTQTPFIDRVLAKHGASNAHPKQAPLPDGAIIASHIEGDKLLDAEYTTYYQAICGDIRFLITATRPDLAFAALVLCKAMHQPTERHWSYARHALAYLRGTRDIGIVFQHNNIPNELKALSYKPITFAFSDSNYASDPETRKSAGGYVFYHFGPIIWTAKDLRRSNGINVSLSSCESEILIGSECAREAIYVDHLRNDFSFVDAKVTIPILLDNSAAKTVATSERWFPKIRHLDVRDMFLREATASGLIEPVSVPTARNVADIFTKPISGRTFRALMLRLNGYEPL